MSADPLDMQLPIDREGVEQLSVVHFEDADSHTVSSKLPV